MAILSTFVLEERIIQMLKVQCERADCQGGSMQIADRQGIEIDYCSLCRGVWLDRGELDKIIERAAAFEQQQRPAAAAPPPAAPPAPQAAPPMQPPQPAYPPQAQPPYPQQPVYQRYDDDDWEDRHPSTPGYQAWAEDYYRRKGRYPKRKSFLGEMFDIFD
jgi:uncharacterized protein